MPINLLTGVGGKLTILDLHARAGGNPQSGQETKHGAAEDVFLSELPFEHLNHLPRYLKAAQMRLDKLRINAIRDAGSMAEYAPLWQSYERRALQLAKAGVVDEDLQQFRWRLEELRVQLYAQELRTPIPVLVSVKRL